MTNNADNLKRVMSEQSRENETTKIRYNMKDVKQ